MEFFRHAHPELVDGCSVAKSFVFHGYTLDLPILREVVFYHGFLD